MRINENEYLGLKITKRPYSLVMDEIWQQEETEAANGVRYIDGWEKVLPIVRYVTALDDIKSHLLTASAIEVINNISIPDSLDFAELNKGERHIFNVLVGKERVMRICWEPQFVFVTELHWTSPIDVFWHTGLAKTGKFAGQKWETNTEKAIQRALQFLIFLRYTDPEFLLVAAGKKCGTRKEGYYNATTSDLIVVDSTWNKFIIRTEGFGVTGHFRLQPHGEKSQLRKLIWIQPHQKHGYVRRPKSDTSTN